MQTVILFDGWVFRGEVSQAGNLMTIQRAECLAHGSGKWKPADSAVVNIPATAVLAIIEG